MSVSNQLAVQRAALHENSTDHQDMQGSSTDVVRETLQFPTNTMPALLLLILTVAIRPLMDGLKIQTATQQQQRSAKVLPLTGLRPGTSVTVSKQRQAPLTSLHVSNSLCCRRYPLAIAQELDPGIPHPVQLLGKSLVLWRPGGEKTWR